MSIEGILLQPGEAQGVSLGGTQVDFLVTGEHAKGCSVFEFSVDPGFDTGAHYHTKIEEIFYVLEGRGTTEIWSGDDESNKQIFEWQAGSLFSPPLNTWHRIVNATSSPALLLAVIDMDLAVEGRVA